MLFNKEKVITQLKDASKDKIFKVQLAASTAIKAWLNLKNPSLPINNGEDQDGLKVDHTQNNFKMIRDKFKQEKQNKNEETKTEVEADQDISQVKNLADFMKKSWLSQKKGKFTKARSGFGGGQVGWNSPPKDNSKFSHENQKKNIKDMILQNQNRPKTANQDKFELLPEKPEEVFTQKISEIDSSPYLDDKNNEESKIRRPSTANAKKNNLEIEEKSKSLQKSDVTEKNNKTSSNKIAKEDPKILSESDNQTIKKAKTSSAKSSTSSTHKQKYISNNTESDKEDAFKNVVLQSQNNEIQYEEVVKIKNKIPPKTYPVNSELSQDQNKINFTKNSINPEERSVTIEENVEKQSEESEEPDDKNSNNEINDDNYLFAQENDVEGDEALPVPQRPRNLKSNDKIEESNMLFEVQDNVGGDEQIPSLSRNNRSQIKSTKKAEPIKRQLDKKSPLGFKTDDEYFGNEAVGVNNVVNELDLTQKNKAHEDITVKAIESSKDQKNLENEEKNENPSTMDNKNADPEIELMNSEIKETSKKNHENENKDALMQNLNNELKVEKIRNKNKIDEYQKQPSLGNSIVNHTQNSVIGKVNKIDSQKRLNKLDNPEIKQIQEKNNAINKEIRQPQTINYESNQFKRPITPLSSHLPEDPNFNSINFEDSIENLPKLSNQKADSDLKINAKQSQLKPNNFEDLKNRENINKDSTENHPIKQNVDLPQKNREFIISENQVENEEISIQESNFEDKKGKSIQISKKSETIIKRADKNNNSTVDMKTFDSINDNNQDYIKNRYEDSESNLIKNGRFGSYTDQQPDVEDFNSIENDSLMEDDIEQNISNSIKQNNPLNENMEPKLISSEKIVSNQPKRDLTVSKISNMHQNQTFAINTKMAKESLVNSLNECNSRQSAGSPHFKIESREIKENSNNFNQFKSNINYDSQINPLSTQKEGIKFPYNMSGISNINPLNSIIKSEINEVKNPSHKLDISEKHPNLQKLRQIFDPYLDITESIENTNEEPLNSNEFKTLETFQKQEYQKNHHEINFQDQKAKTSNLRLPQQVFDENFDDSLHYTPDRNLDQEYMNNQEEFSSTEEFDSTILVPPMKNLKMNNNVESITSNIYDQKIAPNQGKTSELNKGREFGNKPDKNIIILNKNLVEKKEPVITNDIRESFIPTDSLDPTYEAGITKGNVRNQQKFLPLKPLDQPKMNEFCARDPNENHLRRNLKKTENNSINGNLPINTSRNENLRELEVLMSSISKENDNQKDSFVMKYRNPFIENRRFSKDLHESISSQSILKKFTSNDEFNLQTGKFLMSANQSFQFDPEETRIYDSLETTVFEQSLRDTALQQVLMERKKLKNANQHNINLQNKDLIHEKLFTTNKLLIPQNQIPFNNQSKSSLQNHRITKSIENIHDIINDQSSQQPQMQKSIPHKSQVLPKVNPIENQAKDFIPYPEVGNNPKVSDKNMLANKQSFGPNEFQANLNSKNTEKMNNSSEAGDIWEVALEDLENKDWNQAYSRILELGNHILSFF